MSMRLKASAAWLMATALSAASLIAAGGDLRLVKAVEQGDKEAVRSLLEQNVDVNSVQPDGATALAWAAYRDDLETAELLIRAGADVNAANVNGITPLALACGNRSAGMIEKLVRAGANPNAAQKWSGETAFMTCARTGNVEAVKSLVAAGAGCECQGNEAGANSVDVGGGPRASSGCPAPDRERSGRSRQDEKFRACGGWDGICDQNEKPVRHSAFPGELYAVAVCRAAG